MHTPDEIKKGLELCYEDIDCSECPYLDDCFGNDETPFGAVMPDAHALIQQLQAENAQQARCIENMTDKLNAMNDEVAKLQTERDALLKYITDSTWAACDICKHGIDGASVMDCKHIREVGVPCFEWRGVTKEE